MAERPDPIADSGGEFLEQLVVAVAPRPTANWQYQVLSRKSADVATALAANRLAGILAYNLKARRIIGIPVFDQATNYAVGVTEYARVEHLVTAVLTKTEYNPQCYHDFIEVLEIDGFRPDTEAARSLLPAAMPPTGTTTTSFGREGTRVEESALPRLLSILSPVVHSWSLFAQLIGVPSSQSTFIEAANPHPSSSYLFNCFSQSLEWWIANDHNPTYEAILAVLDPKRGQTTPLMNRDLAKQVKEFMAKEQGSTMVDDYTNQNIMVIQGKFANLLQTVRNYLQRKMKEDQIKGDLRQFILQLFPDISSDLIPNTSDLIVLFEAMRNNRLWSYMNYFPLEQIVKKFCGDNPEMTGEIEKFKKDRAGFQLATKIKKYIPAAKACKHEQLNPVNPNHFTKLSHILDECVADYSLNYLEELWQSLSFHMQLPPITIVFEIIDSGSVQIVFLIPTKLVPQVVHQAQYSAYFYKQHRIRRVAVGDNWIYDSLVTVASKQVIPEEEQVIPSIVEHIIPKEEQVIPSIVEHIIPKDEPVLVQTKLKGGYACNFVEPPPVALQTECRVCLQILHEPHFVSCCGNRFCQSCINPIKVGGKSCPLCNAATFELMHDKQLERTLKDLKVHCIHADSGCKWSGELGLLSKHLNVYPESEALLEGCGFVIIKCILCGYRCQRSVLMSHQYQRRPTHIGTSKLDENDLKAVLEAVHDAHGKWHGIGLQLGLAPPVLRGIEQQYVNTEDMLREMLGKWLKQVDPVPTWVALIGALKSKTVSEPRLAEQLIEKHHIIPLPHGILTHTVSDVDARQKQILGRLQATTKEVDSQLDSYEAILQQSKKVPEETVTKEPDALKDEMDRFLDDPSPADDQSQTEGSIPEIRFSDLEFGDQLGEGASGVVYRGHWKSRDMDVAIKRVSGKVNKAEIEILNKLKHPCIIHFHGVSTDRPGPPEHYIITELAEGGSLYDLLHRKNYRPSQEESLRWAAQIAQGMKYLHQQKMMHRDLKSSNVLLTGEGNIKICDFGGAKHFDYTTKQTQAGTYRWMAPEVMKGEPVSLSSDVFSYGMLLYEIFDGRLPFADAKTDVMVSSRIISGEVPPIPGSMESYLANTLKQCWNANPKARPSFHDILEILANRGTAKLHGDDLGIVVEAVYGARYKWYGIGLQLGLVPSVLEGIEQQYSGTEDRLRVLLTHWLKQVDPVPSWVTLIEALRSKTVSELRLAKQLEKYYILPHNIWTHSVSNTTDRHKQLLGQLPAATKQADSQLESYEALQRQSEKVPDETVIKEPNPLHIRNSELEEELERELAELKAKNVLLSTKIEDLRKEEISIIAEKDEEIVQKAMALAHKSQDYDTLVDEMQQLQKKLDFQIEKANTQPSTISRGTTMGEGFLRPFSLSALHGVDKIIDEIEFVLTDEAQFYEWTDSGFKLHTPDGALPAGAVPCRINVKASLTGQFQFPENSELVSPIYWISTPKNVLFSRPLTVHVQHCGTVENSDDSDLSFVVAKCTQPDLPYKFKFLDGGCFVPNSSYGSIPVTHFSGLGIVSKRRKGRSYCARTYVANRGRDRWRVHFVIIQDLDIVLKAVDTHYSFATRDVALRIVFKKSEISLDIPKEGHLINEGWKIQPRTYPSISKKDADEFCLGQWIPACELTVEWEKSGQRPVRLRHQVPLIGAKAPKNYFSIAIDPEWEDKEVTPPPVLPQAYPEHTKQELCLTYPAGLQDKPELCDLMNEVAAKIPSKWRQFGIELRLNTSELDCFSLASPEDALRCFSFVFTLWQNRMSREPYSWLTVVESLNAPSIGEHKLALELKNKLTRTYSLAS